MDELVSIIITTYGGKPDVVNAVESCVNQTYKNIEIIVVDDSGKGTPEQRSTEEFLRKYIESGKIRYIPHEINKNASVARNTGFKNSRGSYIALLDDDDVYFEEKIEKQVTAFRKLPDDYGVVYCSFISTYDNCKPVTYMAETDGDVLYKQLMVHIYSCTSTIMLRRDIFQKLNGFDESFNRHQDWEFMVRAAALTKFHGIEYVGTHKFTTAYVKRFETEKLEGYRNYYLDKMKNEIGKLTPKQQKDVYAYHYLYLADLFFKNKNLKKMWYYFRKTNSIRHVIGYCAGYPIKKIAGRIRHKSNKPVIIHER